MLEVFLKKIMGSFSLSVVLKANKGIVGVLGPSGSGKSLTLRCIAGLIKPDEGEIVVDGKPVFDSCKKVNVPPRERNIGYMFQNYALFPHLTVEQNIEFGLYKLPKKIRKEKVNSMIEKMKLCGYEKHYPFQLSGGQQQRVALARTLITQPRVLLLDEPFSALDNHIRNLVQQEFFQAIRQNFNGTVLMVTHNIDEAYRLCDRIVVFSRGSTVQEGEKGEVFECPDTIDVARITGYKNFFRARILKETQSYYVISTGLFQLRAIKRREYIDRDIIACIRDDHLQVFTSRVENSCECAVVDIIKGVFSETFLVKCGKWMFQVELPKEKSQELKNLKNRTFYLHFPFDKIILLSKED